MERIEAARQEKLERIKKQLEEQRASQPVSADVVIKGSRPPRFYITLHVLTSSA
jgi:hypothetical protein